MQEESCHNSKILSATNGVNKTVATQPGKGVVANNCMDNSPSLHYNAVQETPNKSPDVDTDVTTVLHVAGTHIGDNIAADTDAMQGYVQHDTHMSNEKMVVEMDADKKEPPFMGNVFKFHTAGLPRKLFQFLTLLVMQCSKNYIMVVIIVVAMIILHWLI